MTTLRRVLTATAVVAALTAAPLAVSPALAASSATSKTFYVDCKRSTNGDGSSSRAWNSLASVNKHGAFSAGDRILFKRKSTCNGQLHPLGSGSTKKPIVIGAYSKGAKPVIAGRGTRDKSATIQLTNQSNWTIQDIEVTNWSGTRNSLSYRSGIRLLNDSASTVSGLTVQRTMVEKVSSTMRFNTADAREWGGIVAVTYGSGRFKNLRISKNRVDHVGRTGIMVANRTKNRDIGLRVSGNVVTWTRGDGIVVRGSSSARIDHNMVGHASDQWPCPECGPITPLTANAAIWAATSKNTLIEHNEAYGTKVKGGDGEGFDIDASATSTVLQYNYAHDNQGGGALFCGSTDSIARFNIFENNAKSAIAFIGSLPAKNTQIYNNTIYNSSSSKARPVRYFNGAKGSGITFKNNIVYNYGYSTWLWPTKPKTAANTLIGLHGKGRPADSLTSYRAPGLKNPGSGKNGFSSLNGYKPVNSGSFTKGVAIPKSVKRDFFGKKINPLHPPRGAAG